MARTAYPKTNLNSGEFSPRLIGRNDIDKYDNGVARMLNFLPLPFGGAQFSPGTIFVNEVRNSTKEARIMDWVFGSRQAYILQFNDSKIRFYKDHAIVSSSGAGSLITAITKANPAVVTAASHGLSNGDKVILHGVDGMEEVNEIEFTVANKTLNTFELSGINSSAYNTFIASTATVLLLHLDTDLTDSASVTPHTVTAMGGVAISTDQSEFGGASCYFDGAGDYLSIVDDTDFDFSGGVFTIDCWIRPTDLSSIRYIYQQSTDASNRCQLFINIDGSLQFTVTSAGSTVVTMTSAAGSIAVDTWYHVAVVENGNSWVLFINGGSAATTSDADRCANYTGNVFIGISYDGSSSPFKGYIDEFRITKGVARFAVSGADAQTVLLLHCDGTDASTTFTDSEITPKTVTANGNAQIDTAQSKFGGASGLFDGTGDYLTLLDHADWDFGTADFTVDFWVRFNAISTNNWIFGRNAGNNFDIRYNTSQGLELYIGGGSVQNRSWSPSTGVWYHIAITRNGTNLYFFIDGVLQGAVGTNSSNVSYADPIYIGSDASGGNALNGWIDEFRISKGIARWTANFTPSSGPYGGATVPTHEGYSTNAAGGIYEIAHIYDDDELFDIQTAQAADIMYLAHGDNKPQKLSRYSDASWTIADVAFQNGPYLDENITTTTLDPSGNSGSVTVTASAITGINPTASLPNGSGFQTTDVGRLIRFWDGTHYSWLQITAWTSTTVVTATVIGANSVLGASMSGNVATIKWALGAWSDTTGYPNAVSFFQGRLWWAKDQNIYSSQPLDFENMDPGSADDGDAINYKLNSNQVNLIKWLASGKRLVAGTEGENFTVYSGTANQPVTPTNVKADSETNYGASDVSPVKIGSFHYYVQADTKTVREFYYDFAIDGYRAINKSILSEHITRVGIKQMAFQKTPFGVLYCVLEDGKIATLTREIEQEVTGWADQTTRAGDLYTSVAAIPTTGYDEAWFVVERQVNGSTKKYVEYQVSPNQDVENDLEDMVLMQCALQYDGSPTATVSGLDHLEGEDVVILADGNYLTGTVSGGSVALGASYSVVTVGLAITGQIKLLPLETGSTVGSSQGMEKKVGPIVVRVNNSLGLTVGEDDGNMEELFTDGNGVAYTDLQTRDLEVPSTLGWDQKQQLLFEQSKPFPCTILMIIINNFTSEEKT